MQIRSTVPLPHVAGRHARSLKWRLATFAAALALPILAFVGLLLWQFAAAERSRLEARALERAHALSLAIDRELTGFASTLSVLALAPSLQRGDLEAFYRLATQVRDRTGVMAVLRDRDNRQLVNIRLPWGAPLPVSAIPLPSEAELRSGRPLVTDLYIGAVAQAPLFAVQAPIMKDGDIAFILALTLPVERIRDLIRDEMISPTSVATVVDRKGVILARNRRHEEFVGKPASQTLLTNATGLEGTYRGLTLDGVAILGAYARSPLTEWRVALGVPLEELNAPLRRALGWFLGLGTIIVALSTLLALFIGQRIARPIEDLANRAAGLARGEALQPLHSALGEANRVAETLSAASASLREREAALRESEARFRTLADNIPILCWIADEKGWIFWYNRRWYEYTGTTPADMEGWGWQSIHDPEILPGVLERWGASIATGEPFEMTFPLKGADGVFRHFLTRVAPVRDAEGRIVRWFGSNTDITEQRETERVLREREANNARLAAIVSSSSDAIVSFAAEDGRILSWNKGAEALFGYAETEAIGAPASLLVPADRPEGPNGVFDWALAGGRVSQYETVRVTKSGEPIDVAVTAARMVADDGHVIGVSAVFNDIRDRKRTEAQLQAREAELRRTEARYRVVVESAIDVAIITMDLEGRITGWNTGAENVLGWQRDEVIGEGAELIFTQEDRAAGVPETEMGTALAKGRAPDERWHLRKDGSRFFATGALLPKRDEAGTLLGFLKMLRDRTQEREVDEAVRSLNETLEGRVASRTAELEAANERLVAEAAHREKAGTSCVSRRRWKRWDA